jgi:hypothetical protein
MEGIVRVEADLHTCFGAGSRLGAALQCDVAVRLAHASEAEFRGI